MGPALLFYLSVIIATPFAIGPDPQLLAQIGAAILWLGALLASMFGFERLFQEEREDGSLDQFSLSPHPLAAIVFVKCLAHWLVMGLPLVILSPVFALILSMEADAVFATFLTLLAGSPALFFIGAIGAALTLSLARGGLLLSALIAPFCLPSVIFGVGAGRGAIAGGGLAQSGFASPFLMLAALSLFFAVLGPFFAAAALRYR